MTRIVAGMLSAGMLFLFTISAPAQDYPSKPIRISTVQTGGGTDFIARIIANGITGPLGQSVIVENRPTLIAIETAMKAPPDGYTVLIVGNTVWTQPLLRLKPAWDAERDFSPVTSPIISPYIVLVHPSLPVKSIKELIALAKARPGELNFASASVGSGTHLMGEYFNAMAGVNIVAIQYKSSVLGLIGGEVHVGFEGAPGIMTHVKSGRTKALAVGSENPSALLPGVPTVADAGLPGFVAVSAQSVFLPAKAPAAIIRRLNQEVVRAVNLPDAKARILESGAEPFGNSPEEFAAFIKADTARWSKAIKEAKLKPE